MLLHDYDFVVWSFEKKFLKHPIWRNGMTSWVQILKKKIRMDFRGRQAYAITSWVHGIFFVEIWTYEIGQLG